MFWMNHQLWVGIRFALVVIGLGTAACTPIGGGGSANCTDNEMVCADGSTPVDGLCGEGADAVDAICPPRSTTNASTNGGEAQDSAGIEYGGIDAVAGEPDESDYDDIDGPAGGEAYYGGESHDDDGADSVVGTPENPAALGEACVMANGDAGICVSDMTTSCRVALNGSPCEGVNNGCCPDGQSMPKDEPVGGEASSVECYEDSDCPNFGCDVCSGGLCIPSCGGSEDTYYGAGGEARAPTGGSEDSYYGAGGEESAPAGGLDGYYYAGEPAAGGAEPAEPAAGGAAPAGGEAEAEYWYPSERSVDRPNNFRFYRPSCDFNADCWSDGGSNAFDCFGNPRIGYNFDTRDLDARPTDNWNRRYDSVAGYRIEIKSALHNNVWRYQILPRDSWDRRRVTLNFSGTVGSRDSTIWDEYLYDFAGREVPYLFTRDRWENDPSTVMVLVGSDPDDHDRVSYDVRWDGRVTIEGNLRLPATLYVVPGYFNFEQVIREIFENLRVDGPPAGRQDWDEDESCQEGAAGADAGGAPSAGTPSAGGPGWGG